MKKTDQQWAEELIPHWTCEDGWYSCPKSEEGCLNKADGDRCTCGADTRREEFLVFLAKARQQEREGGIGLIAAERKRQIEVEGWTPEHDAKHTDGSLAKAAGCYVETSAAQVRMNLFVVPDSWPKGKWPWSPSWWKPSADPVRNLVKAGALIAAEIDRLLRARSRKEVDSRE